MLPYPHAQGETPDGWDFEDLVPLCDPAPDPEAALARPLEILEVAPLITLGRRKKTRPDQPPPSKKRKSSVKPARGHAGRVAVTLPGRTKGLPILRKHRGVHPLPPADYRVVDTFTTFIRFRYDVYGQQIRHEAAKTTGPPYKRKLGEDVDRGASSGGTPPSVLPHYTPHVGGGTPAEALRASLSFLQWKGKRHAVLCRA